jgi:hypothetical protein
MSRTTHIRLTGIGVVRLRRPLARAYVGVCALHS